MARDRSLSTTAFSFHSNKVIWIDPFPFLRGGERTDCPYLFRWLASSWLKISLARSLTLLGTPAKRATWIP